MRVINALGMLAILFLSLPTQATAQSVRLARKRKPRASLRVRNLITEASSAVLNFPKAQTCRRSEPRMRMEIPDGPAPITATFFIKFIIREVWAKYTKLDN